MSSKIQSPPKGVLGTILSLPRRAFVAAGVLCMGVSFLLFFEPLLSMPSQSMDEIMLLDERASNIGIVTIATNGFDAIRLVKTIRENGKFKGDVFVLGDDCSERPKDATYIKVPQPDGRQGAKHLKQEVFELTGAQRLLYMDADMVVNKPLDDFFAAIGPWDPSCSAYMFKERWYTASDFNAGTDLLDKVHSAEWMAAWKADIEAHPEYNRDQFALRDIMATGKYQLCPLPPEITFVADLFSRYSLRGIHSKTFTHWTSAKEEKKPEPHCVDRSD